MTSAADRLLDPIRAVSEDAVDPQLIADDVTIDKLELDGKRYTLVVGDAIEDATIEQNIEGASTLTLVLRDSSRELLRSGLFDPMNGAITAKVDAFEFTLVQANKSGDELSLTFEDKQVNDLRRVVKPKKADRRKVTRAQFAFSIVSEVKPRMGFYSPDMKVVQPIGKAADRKSKTQKGKGRDYGFAPKAGVKVKHTKATREQLRNIERVLDAGVSRGVHDRVLLAAVATITQESTAVNLKGGDADSTGLFQQRKSQGWPATRDIEKDATAFYDAAAKKFKADPSVSVGNLCQNVQRSATPQAYKRWVSEASHTLKLYKGGGGNGQAGKASKRYEFTRGLPGGEKGENSWDCLKRLADEVQWRCFAVGGAIYFVSEERLFASKPRMTVNEYDEEVLGLDFDIDSGKKVHEATLTIRANRWVAAPGTVIALDDAGPATGRWLVATSSRSLFSNTTEVTLRKPNLGRDVGVEPEASDDTSTKDLTNAGVPKHVQAAYKKAKAITKKRYPYVKGGGHGDKFTGPYDCSGAVSAVLHAAGHLTKPMATGALKGIGKTGVGKFMTVWVKDDGTNQSHAFIEFTLPGRDTEHFGTGRWGKTWGGAGLNPTLHPHDGFTARHFTGE